MPSASADRDQPPGGARGGEIGVGEQAVGIWMRVHELLPKLAAAAGNAQHRTPGPQQAASSRCRPSAAGELLTGDLIAQCADLVEARLVKLHDRQARTAQMR
jgi:hypothetical protein